MIRTRSLPNIFPTIAALLLLAAAAAAGTAEPVIEGAYPGIHLPATDGLNIFFDESVIWSTDAPKWDEYSASATTLADTFTAYVMLSGPVAPAMTALEFRLRVEADPAVVLRLIEFAANDVSVVKNDGAVKGDGNTINLEAVYAQPVPLDSDPLLLLSVKVEITAASLREIRWYLEPSTSATIGAPAYRDGDGAWRELQTLPAAWSEPVIVLNQPYVAVEAGSWGDLKTLFR